MIELSKYGFETLRADEEFKLYRGCGAAELPRILVLAPSSDEPEPGAIERLQHEYSFLVALDVACSPKPLAFARHEGRTMLVLEDPGGEPLDHFLGQPMDLGQFLPLAIALASRLGRLHRQGLIHKDIKPANILVDPAINAVWFIGFGIASRLPRERQSIEPPEVIAGTLAYMAPEQTGRMNRSIDSRSDLYALGITFYEMLTGAPPFRAADPMEWIHCHIARQPAPPEERAPGIPAPLSAIVMKLLAKTAEERYQTAAGLESDLERCLAEWKSIGRILSFRLGERDLSDQLFIPEKLYGRVEECKELIEAFDRMVAGGRPELVLVSGYSGIGKSSIVNELHKVVLPNGIFLSGKFDQNKREIPYVTLAQAFRTLIRQILSKNEEELNYWHDAILEALGSNAQLIVNLIAELELVIGKQPPMPELSSLEAQNRFEAVLRQFLGVFAQKEHPLVLFLDDLQWIDPATLRLLEQFIIYPDIGHLLLIGAYRDNEVTASHPLMLALKAIRENGPAVHEILLKPLSLEDVNQLVADALHCQSAHTRQLAALVHRKTAGNPFFTLQFLSTLADEQLLAYEPQQSVWRWNVKRIRALGLTDNVADLMIAKLRRLPAATQEALKQLACLGHGAGCATLSIIRGGTEQSVHQELWEAVRAGLIQRSGASYKFLHDRIREAAYLLIPEELRARFHLDLGRLLVLRMTPEQRAGQIFDIANQLNAGLALISDPFEQEQVAGLNFMAGKKAKASAAYASACVYLAAGIALIGANAWERRYQLALGLWLECAECEYLDGNFDVADGLIGDLLDRAKSKVDKAATYRLKILLDVMRAQYRRAADTGLECLRLFGIDIPAHPSWEQVRVDYEKIWQNLGDRSVESLIELPFMSDPEKQAAMQVLAELSTPAWYTDRNLFCLHVCHMTNISLKYGITGASPHGFAELASLLGPVFHRFPDGYRFGTVACSLVDKYKFAGSKMRAYLGMARVAPWTQPMGIAVDFVRRAFRAGIDTHERSYACFTYIDLVTNLLIEGVHLDQVWSEAEKGLNFARNAKFRDAVDFIRSQQQFIQNMRGRTVSFGSPSDDQFDERAFEAQLTEDRMSTMACYYWIFKLQARFMSGDYDIAIAAAQKAKALLWSAETNIQSLNYCYFKALTLAAMHDVAGPQTRAEALEELKRSLEQLREWSDNCPETFVDKYRLVSAELARIQGRELDAMRFYEDAIQAARQYGFTQNEGIGNELASRFYLKRGYRTVALSYLCEARHCYLRWGALGKVNQLDERYPGLEEKTPGRSAAMRGTPAEQLDLMTVLKASHAVSGEIVLEKSIQKLMTVAIEHAGAERGLLILPHGEDFRTEAEARTSHDKVDVYLQQTRVDPAEAPESILRYVIRTHESVILDDASVENLFTDDKYLQQRRPKSVLCLPLLKQRQLIGMLYLENNLAPGVFTPKRVSVLELLASQAAISLDHARLYDELTRTNEDLRAQIGERARAEAALKKSEQQLQDIIDHTSALVTVKDLDLRYILANREHKRAHAYRDQIRGKTDYEILPQELAETIRANDRLAIETGKPIQFELTLPMADGERHYVVVKVPLRDAAGKPYAVCGISTDITGLKRAEKELREKEASLREAQSSLAHVSRLTMMGELAVSIAHEVNQPLTAILNNANACLALLPSETKDLDEPRAALSDIVSDAHRASAVIARIRGLVEKVPPQKSRLNINETIEEVIALARGELNRNGVSLQTRIANDLPPILGDRIQLQQVLLNLIINAIESMSGVTEGPRELLVSSQKVTEMPDEPEQDRLAETSGLEAQRHTPNAERRTQNAYMLVSVADSGPGLDPKDLNRLFDAFYTTKAQGLGMGLAISRSIVEAHRGRLWAMANVPRGALFQFTLPIGQSE